MVPLKVYKVAIAGKIIGQNWLLNMLSQLSLILSNLLTTLHKIMLICVNGTFYVVEVKFRSVSKPSWLEELHPHFISLEHDICSSWSVSRELFFNGIIIWTLTWIHTKLKSFEKVAFCWILYIALLWVYNMISWNLWDQVSIL